MGCLDSRAVAGVVMMIGVMVVAIGVVAIGTRVNYVYCHI
jgi:hypothetical protein